MRFRRNPYFEVGLRQQPRFDKGMGERTILLSVVIKAASSSFSHSGHYKRSITPMAGGPKGYRVELHDIAWHIIEYGSVNNPPYSPVRRAVAELGWRFEDAGGRPTGA